VTPRSRNYQLVALRRDPRTDFPGGLIVQHPKKAPRLYANGTGTIKLRGVGEIGRTNENRRRSFGLTRDPYGVNKAVMVERITELVYANKTALVEEVRDCRAKTSCGFVYSRKTRTGKVSVPLQTHPAAKTIQRQPDLSDPHGEPEGPVPRQTTHF